MDFARSAFGVRCVLSYQTSGASRKSILRLKASLFRFRGAFGVHMCPRVALGSSGSIESDAMTHRTSKALRAKLTGHISFGTQGVGRGCGVGRGLGNGVGLGVTVGVDVAIGVGLGVTVEVGVGVDV